jgi:hypothetical protein
VVQRHGRGREAQQLCADARAHALSGVQAAAVAAQSTHAPAPFSAKKLLALRSAAVAAARRDTCACARSARAKRDTGGRSGVAAT